jgi:hypothetical protein
MISFAAITMPARAFDEEFASAIAVFSDVLVCDYSVAVVVL